MAALAYTYLAKSASVAGVALSGTVSFTEKRNGQVIDLSSDADIYQRLVCMNKVEEVIEVESLDVAAAVSIAASGATTLVGAKHTGGVTLAGTLTCTAAASTITAIEKSINQDGRPVLRITVTVKSSDGAASGIVWAAA